jgi:hypothetical protein
MVVTDGMEKNSDQEIQEFKISNQFKMYQISVFCTRMHQAGPSVANITKNYCKTGH